MASDKNDLGARKNRMDETAKQIVLQCFVDRALLARHPKSCDGIEITMAQEGEMLSIRALERATQLVAECAGFSRRHDEAMAADNALDKGCPGSRQANDKDGGSRSRGGRQRGEPVPGLRSDNMVDFGDFAKRIIVERVPMKRASSRDVIERTHMLFDVFIFLGQSEMHQNLIARTKRTTADNRFHVGDVIALSCLGPQI